MGLMNGTSFLFSGGVVTSAGIPDPYTPPDGDWNITGALTVSGNVTSGGVFSAADGTVSAPSYGFTDDAELGMYRLGSDHIGFTCAGTVRFQIHSNRTRCNDFWPLADSNYDLGGTSVAWLDAYIHGSVYLDDDNDTYITSDTDDALQVVCGGSEIVEFAAGVVTVSDSVNFLLNTTTGTKIGTGTTQKLGFWNATPIVQPSSTGETTGFTAGSGTGVNDDSTFTGNVGSTAYRLSDIVKHLKNAGLIAA